MKIWVIISSGMHTVYTCHFMCVFIISLKGKFLYVAFLGKTTWAF